MKNVYYLFLLLLSATVAGQPGKPDSTFNKNGKLISGFNGLQNIDAIALQKNNKILVAGSNSINFLPLIRYTKNGYVDTSFGDNGKIISTQKKHPQFTGIALQSDEKIIVAGTANLSGFYNQAVLYRFTTNGIPDSTFGDNGFAFLSISQKNIDSRTPAIAIQNDDKMIIAGNAGDESFIARFTADGKRDSSFSGNGVHLVSLGKISKFSSLALQSNGKIIVVGSAGQNNKSKLAVVRFETNGRFDESFGNKGQLLVESPVYTEGSAVKIYPDGKIILAANTITNGKRSVAVVRVKTNGTIDSSFANNGWAFIEYNQSLYASSLALDADGKIVIAGSAAIDATGSKQLFAVVRLKPNGIPDNIFGNKGIVTTDFLPHNASASDVIIQPDKNILAAGGISNENLFKHAMVRYVGGNPTIITQTNQMNESLVKIYPNPVKNILIIENLVLPKTTFIITNRAGDIIKTTTVSEKTFQWNVSDLKPGYYYLTIQTGNEQKPVLFLKE